MTKLSDTQRVMLSKATQHEALLAEPPAKLPAAARQSVLRSLMAKGLLEEIAALREHHGLGWRQDEEGVWLALRITQAGMLAIGIEAEVQPEPVDNAVVDVVPPAGEERLADSDGLAPGQGESLTAVAFVPPSASGEAPQGPQRPPVSQRGGSGRAAALRMAAAAVTAAWDAPGRGGLEDAVAALRRALDTQPGRAPRDPSAPRQPRTGTKQEAVLALLRRDEGTTIARIIDATGWQPHTVRGFLAGLKRKGITVEVLERVRQVGPNKQGAKGSFSVYRIAAGAPAPAEAG